MCLGAGGQWREQCKRPLINLLCKMRGFNGSGNSTLGLEISPPKLEDRTKEDIKGECGAKRSGPFGVLSPK